jgi:hypothetical protein
MKPFSFIAFIHAVWLDFCGLGSTDHDRDIASTSTLSLTRQPASKEDGPLNMLGGTCPQEETNIMAYALKSVGSSLYFVEGKGFVATVASDATPFDNRDDAESTSRCAASMGINAVIEKIEPNIKQNADGTSFAVSFVRPNNLDGVGGVRPHRLNPSARRFKTREEADIHGARFVKYEKHLGHYVTQVREPVNAWINPETGFTNPVIGRARLGGTRD